MSHARTTSLANTATAASRSSLDSASTAPSSIAPSPSSASAPARKEVSSATASAHWDWTSARPCVACREKGAFLETCKNQEPAQQKQAQVGL